VAAEAASTRREAFRRAASKFTLNSPGRGDCWVRSPLSFVLQCGSSLPPGRGRCHRPSRSRQSRQQLVFAWRSSSPRSEENNAQVSTPSGARIEIDQAEVGAQPPAAVRRCQWRQIIALPFRKSGCPVSQRSTAHTQNTPSPKGSAARSFALHHNALAAVDHAALRANISSQSRAMMPIGPERRRIRAAPAFHCRWFGRSHLQESPITNKLFRGQVRRMPSGHGKLRRRSSDRIRIDEAARLERRPFRQISSAF